MSTVRWFIILSCLLSFNTLGLGCASESDNDSAEIEAVVADAVDPVYAAVDMNPVDLEAWEIRLVEHRIDKNETFSESDDTPLLPEDREGFVGLNYYYPARELRFKVPFMAEAKPDTIELVKRQGNLVQNLRKGSVTFAHAGELYTLAVFGPVDTTEHGDYLWLPFYDATNDELTYPGGRYLDLELDADGMVELDFNFSYNPLCDYNHEKYNCTLPPAENRLPIKIEAGEQLFRLPE